jgi:signal transduction histidine kinase
MTIEEKVNILVVDDTPANLVAMEAILANLGQNVVKARSGREALKHLLHQDFAVILLDVKMPELDGYGTAALIRQRPRSEHTPIIFVTAHDPSASGRSRGYSLGAVDYIYVPVVPEILKAKVASFVELSKIQLLHKQAERRARQEATRAKTLARIAARLTAELDFQGVLHIVCQETAAALDLSAALVSLYSDAEEVYCLASDCGLPPLLRRQLEIVPRFLYHSSNQSDHQVTVIPDLQQMAGGGEVELLAGQGVRSVACAMMVRDGQPIGCLTLLTLGETRHFSEQDLEFLRGLVDQATLAISNARLFGEINSKQRQLRQLTQKLVMVQEEERQHIARELHDQAGQVMIALQILLGLVKQQLPPELEMLHQELGEAMELTKKMAEDVRTLAHTLRPPLLDEERLNSILETLCRDFARHTHITINYKGIEVPPLPENAPISLYRFVQEALTNAAKYAQAEQINVTLRRQSHQIVLTVEDDGVGFDPQEKMSAAGMGLVAMQQRFEMLGGDLAIDSRPGAGCRLTASVPCVGQRRPPLPAPEPVELHSPARANIVPGRR